LSDNAKPESRLSCAVWISIACLIGLFASYFWASAAPSTASKLLLAVFQVSTVSIVIWLACDPFADAAQFLGEQWRIPSSVRGATLDAVASSLPELFTGLFFVVVMLTAADQQPDQALNGNPGEGFGATIATCAGSAVYNMILIPAFCGITIALTRIQKPIIEIDRKVISRDGFWFLVCEVVLVVFLFQKQLTWHLAAILIGLYAIYLTWLWIDARKYRVARADAIALLRDKVTPDDQQIRDALAQGGINASPNLIDYVRRELGDDVNLREEVDDVESAGVLFGCFDIPLSATVAYCVLVASTFVTAIACYWLVNVTVSIAMTLQIPVFFVAVIVAAAASSVPDTLLSVGAAQRGDDDGAVSNAFGSNIFDICICLSVPLIAGIYLNGGRPIDLLVDGEPMPGLFGLQVLLLTLTAITLGILAHRLRLTFRKSIVLVCLYLIFISYAVLGSLGI
jgi:cation:H+ antiporter